MRLPRTKRHAFFGAFHTSHSYGLPLDLWSLRHFEEPMSGPPWDFAALLLPLLRQHTCSCAFVLPPLKRKNERTGMYMERTNETYLYSLQLTPPWEGNSIQLARCSKAPREGGGSGFARWDHFAPVSQRANPRQGGRCAGARRAPALRQAGHLRQAGLLEK